MQKRNITGGHCDSPRSFFQDHLCRYYLLVELLGRLQPTVLLLPGPVGTRNIPKHAHRNTTSGLALETPRFLQPHTSQRPAHSHEPAKLRRRSRDASCVSIHEGAARTDSLREPPHRVDGSNRVHLVESSAECLDPSTPSAHRCLVPILIRQSDRRSLHFKLQLNNSSETTIT